MSSPQQLSWANNLRATATFAVIVLHTSASVEMEFGKIPTHEWIAGNIIDTFTRWCVPIFVMLTGSFALNNYDGNLKLFLSKTFKRIVLPFIFWSTIYLFFYDGKLLLNGQVAIKEKTDLLIEKLLSGTAVHLWFVYMIIGMYLLIPVLSRWVKDNKSKSEQCLFLSIWIASLFIQPLWDKYDISFDISYFSGFIGYLILGNYLFKEKKQVNLALLILLFLSLVGYTCYMTYTSSVSAKEMSEIYLDNLKINIVLLSAVTYMLFKNWHYTSPALVTTTINLICKYSYGIYLIHLLILTLLFNNGITCSLIHPAISIPAISVLCMALSTLSIYLLNKIPYLRNLVG